MQSWLSPNSLLVALCMRWPAASLAAIVLAASLYWLPLSLRDTAIDAGTRWVASLAKVAPRPRKDLPTSTSAQMVAAPRR